MPSDDELEGDPRYIKEVCPNCGTRYTTVMFVDVIRTDRCMTCGFIFREGGKQYGVFKQGEPDAK